VTDQGGGSSNRETRDAVAYVCDQLDTIRSTLKQYNPDGEAEVERVLTALAAGDDLAEPLRSLHEAVLRAGDAGGVLGRSRGSKLIGELSGMPDERVLMCPLDQCSRYVWPGAADGIAHCRISRQPLREERL